jgi:hypothetical protein
MTASTSTRGCFKCRSLARYGADNKSIVRFNKVLGACELEQLMLSAGLIDASGGPKFPLTGCSRPFPILTEESFPLHPPAAPLLVV